MTHKSKIFSAFAIAAAGTFMITTTAYQSKAASGINGNNYHVDEGTGYAGGEVAAVASLNTTSSGTFHYDAPGTDDDIKIEGKDITDIETAVKALSRQITGLGDTAKAADMSLDSSTATAITNASTANSTSLADIKQSIDELKDALVSSGGVNGTVHGELVKTDFGYVNIDQAFRYNYNGGSGMYGLGYVFGQISGSGTGANIGGSSSRSGPIQWVVYSGLLSRNQLKTAAPDYRVIGTYAEYIIVVTSSGGLSYIYNSGAWTFAPLVD